MKLWMRIENIVCSPDMYKIYLISFQKYLIIVQQYVLDQ